jgi:hypothetical protein
MTFRLGLGAGVVAAAVLATGVAYAHHGWSSYDATKVMKPTAQIQQSSWGSPHGAIVITIEGKSWDVVLAPISRMEARGLKAEDIAVGKTVTVEAYPRSDGTAEMRAERITAGGKTVELR